MESLDDFKLFLPKYLTPEDQKGLFEELKNFPANIDSRLYLEICRYDNIIYQGDGIDKLPVINLPDRRIEDVPVMVISNTCDIDPRNERMFKANICYCPIWKLKKYQEMLIKNGEKEAAVDEHIRRIKQQSITQIFYLPPSAVLKEEHIIFFDRINNCVSDYIKSEEVKERKLFFLSNLGLYLFVTKLSIHFTRINEGWSRD
ncbi:MAG: hypothetical protein KKB82_03245 [Candidatus Omnitrophica bacterium]|nr:hypothetical protein [Candidatus Omnitrophota bacterium]MBU1924921.1 hypothetical protein [Candidatus Omnitrophota bacterium]MBU2064105.1 hypothetical protein [Candidatus Omnitrophota bacterium]